MKRSLLVMSAALLAVLAPAAASAQIIELGNTSPSPLVAPVCPPGVSAANCTIVLTRVTALATVRSGVAYPTTVHQAGVIVAFTLGISALSSNRTTRRKYIHSLDTQFGGVPLAYVTILHPVGAHHNFQWKVTAVSAQPVHLIPYLGEVAQFPLPTALPVSRGDVVALTTPTWAPVLSIQQPHATYAYRQSRSTNCNIPPISSAAQLTIGASTTYKCDYAGTRVEYSATEITTPTFPKNYVHARDVAGAASLPDRRLSASGGAAIGGD